MTMSRKQKPKRQIYYDDETLMWVMKRRMVLADRMNEKNYPFKVGSALFFALSFIIPAAKFLPLSAEHEMALNSLSATIFTIDVALAGYWFVLMRRWFRMMDLGKSVPLYG